MWAMLDDPKARLTLYAGALVLASIVVNYLMLQLTGWSALWPVRSWALGVESPGDSWRVMFQALDFVRAHPDQLLYQEIFFEQQTRFQYAPTSLLTLVGLEALGLNPTPALMDAINRVLILANAGAVAAIAWTQTPKAHHNVRIAAAALCAAATLLFYPVMMAYHLGQLQVWINAAFAFACLSWLRGGRIGPGVLIGLICLMKPQFGLFALWALIRREWRFFAGLAVAGAVGLVISVVLFGFANHLDYLSVLQFLSRTGESYSANQSVNGIVHRLLGHGAGSSWDANAFPPFHPLVYGASLLSTLAFLAAALWLKRGAGPRAGLLDFQLAALAFTMASPIAWEHHYGVLAPMLASLFALLVSDARRVLAGRAALTFALAFVLCANAFQFTWAWTAAPLNLAHATLFAGAMMVFWLLRTGVRFGVAGEKAGAHIDGRREANGP